MSAAAFVAHLWKFSLQASVVLAVVALLLRAGRRWSPAVRLRLLHGSLACALLTPFVSAFVVTRLAPIAADGGDGRGPLAIVSNAASVDTLGARPGIAGVLASAIVLGAVIRLAWLVAGHRRFRRGSAMRVAPEVEREIAVQQGALGADARVEWRDGLAAPSTFGRRPAVVVLPVWLAAADVCTRRAVVVHELLHVRRGDWSAVLLEELLRAALWFHPGVHWAIAEIRLTREQLVDREVVELLGAQRAYLEVLLSYTAAPGVIAAGVPFFGRRQLERRIRHLTEETMMRSRAGVVLAAGALLLGGSAAAAATMFPVVGSAASAAASQTSAQEKQDTEEKTLPRVVHEVAAVYPDEAREAKVQGTVVVDVTVDTDGRVSATKVVQSIPELDAAAVDALRQWRFEPGRVKGEPVKVTVSIEVRFALK
jgi:TonB family protein